MKIQKPSEGRVVHFKNSRSEHAPFDVAVVLRVDKVEPWKVDIVYFVPETMQTKYAHAVPHCADASKLGTWRYPPFVKDEIESPE